MFCLPTIIYDLYQPIYKKLESDILNTSSVWINCSRQHRHYGEVTLKKMCFDTHLKEHVYTVIKSEDSRYLSNTKNSYESIRPRKLICIRTSCWSLAPFKITIWYCINIKPWKYMEGICASLFKNLVTIF